MPKSDCSGFSSVLFIQIVFTAEEKLIWKFLDVFSSSLYQDTMVCKVVHSSAQSCQQHPLGIKDSKFMNLDAYCCRALCRYVFYLSPSVSKTIFPHIFYCRQVSPIMQGVYTQTTLVSALPTTSTSTTDSEEGRKKNQKDFCLFSYS